MEFARDAIAEFRVVIAHWWRLRVRATGLHRPGGLRAVTIKLIIKQRAFVVNERDQSIPLKLIAVLA